MATVNLLIVIDPAAEEHPAHRNITELLHRKELTTTFNFTLLFAIDPEGTNTQAANEENSVDASLIAELEAPFKEMNVQVSSRISWSHEWPETILKNADLAGASTIMLSHPGKESRHLADNFWKLIRTTTLPLIIINPDRTERSPRVLMAMDLQDEGSMERNQRILKSGKQAAALWDSELHLLNAYSDSRAYPDRGRLVNLSGLPNDNVHVIQGEPDDAMGQMTQELNPTLLVIGATRRNTGIRAAMRGVKVAKMFSKIQHDIMVVT